MEEAAQAEMVLERRVLKAVPVAPGEEVTFTCTTKGVRLILGAYRNLRIFLGVWRLMGRAGLWMGMGGIRVVAVIGLSLMRACESIEF